MRNEVMQCIAQCIIETLRYLNSQGWGHDTVIDCSAHACQLPLLGRHFQRQQMLVPALPTGASDVLLVPSVMQNEHLPMQKKKTMLYSPWAIALGRKVAMLLLPGFSLFQIAMQVFACLVSSCRACQLPP